MIDIFDLVARWRKQILLFVLLSVVVVGVIVFLQPSKYLSVATALPAPAYAADRTSVFSENLQSLYPPLGSADDLDRILGTSLLDTVYFSVSGRNIDSKSSSQNEIQSRKKEALALKKNTKVIRSEYGELKVKVWDTDPGNAATLANAIMEELQSIHQKLQNAGNALILDGIKKEYAKRQSEYSQLSDSMNGLPENRVELLQVKRNTLLQQILQFGKLAGEYELMVGTQPRTLLVVETAKPSLHPDKPRRVLVLVATLVLSFIFSILVIMTLERGKTQP